MPEGIIGAAAEFVAKKYGGTFADSTDVVSVGTSAAEILRNDPERVFVLLLNLSVNTIFVGFDQTVSSARGIFLGASGGSYQVDTEEDFTIPARSMFAVSTGVSSNLYVVTVRRISKVVEAEL